MNPKQWQQFQLPKFATPKTASNRLSPPVGQASDNTVPTKSATETSSSGAVDEVPTESGDLGETPLAHLEEPSTAAAVHQRQDKNDPGDPGAKGTASDGLPQPEDVMAEVPGTQTEGEKEKGKKRESFMGVEWGKMNIFANVGKDNRGERATSSEQGSKTDAAAIEAQVPGVLDDLTEDERRNFEVEDGVAMESSTASLNSKNGDKDKAAPVNSVSQRKDLEAKIIREMVRDLSNGKSSGFLGSCWLRLYMPLPQADSSTRSKPTCRTRFNTSESSFLLEHSRRDSYKHCSRRSITKQSLR